MCSCSCAITHVPTKSWLCTTTNTKHQSPRHYAFHANQWIHHHPMLFYGYPFNMHWKNPLVYVHGCIFWYVIEEACQRYPILWILYCFPWCLKQQQQYLCYHLNTIHVYYYTTTTITRWLRSLRSVDWRLWYVHRPVLWHVQRAAHSFVQFEISGATWWYLKGYNVILVPMQQCWMMMDTCLHGVSRPLPHWRWCLCNNASCRVNIKPLGSR